MSFVSGKEVQRIVCEVMEHVYYLMGKSLCAGMSFIKDACITDRGTDYTLYKAA